MIIIDLNYPKNIPAIQVLADSNDQRTVEAAVACMLPYVESGETFYEVYHAYIEGLTHLVHEFDYKPTERESVAAEAAYNEVVSHLGLMVSDIT